jgi:hypothetical protein
MILEIYVNSQFYREWDLGDVASWNMAVVVQQMRREYDQGLMGDLAPTPNYVLDIGERE